MILLRPQLVFNPVIRKLLAAIFYVELHAPPFIIEDMLDLFLAPLVQYPRNLFQFRVRRQGSALIRDAHLCLSKQ